MTDAEAKEIVIDSLNKESDENCIKAYNSGKIMALYILGYISSKEMDQLDEKYGIDSVIGEISEEAKKTRQDVFLERYPNAQKYYNGALTIDPCSITGKPIEGCHWPLCQDCSAKYWLAPADEEGRDVFVMNRLGKREEKEKENNK